MSAAPASSARLVLALPPEETALALLDSALAMAERLEREMVALLVEDRRFSASAALPFTRIVTGAGEREFDTALAERMLRAVAERARLRLAEVAAARRVRWRLETTHGLEALALGADDVLAVATASTLWREEPPVRLPCPLLVLGRAGGPREVVHRGGRGPLELARELARRAQMPLVVVACEEAAAVEARKVLGEEARIERCPDETEAALDERLRMLGPGFVLVESCEDRAAWRAAVEAVRAAASRAPS
ncbi:MAG: hypothetical protein NZ555_02845 [Geminicoccaceae bacterium]|nr:hypothetical protein [Geminicoccaceae bacterium]